MLSQLVLQQVRGLLQVAQVVVVEASVQQQEPVQESHEVARALRLEAQNRRQVHQLPLPVKPFNDVQPATSNPRVRCLQVSNHLVSHQEPLHQCPQVALCLRDLCPRELCPQELCPRVAQLVKKVLQQPLGAVAQGPWVPVQCPAAQDHLAYPRVQCHRV